MSTRIINLKDGTVVAVAADPQEDLVRARRNAAAEWRRYKRARRNLQRAAANFRRAAATQERLEVELGINVPLLDRF